MYRVILIVATVALGISSSPDIYASWLFGPGNFDECISDYQPEAESTTAAKLIHIACSNKFKKKQKIDHANCLLDHVLNTRSDLAVKAIALACANLYIHDKSHAWSRCILRNMEGTKVDQAARSIAATCKD